MNFKVHKLTNYHFISSVKIKDLINEVSRVYNKSRIEISKEYAPENISEEYYEYIILSATSEKVFLDNLVLFTKEKFDGEFSDIKINKFVLGDGFSKLIILNNLLITKEFISKRLDILNIGVFKDLYKDVFKSQTKLSLYYLNVTLAILKSNFNNDIERFEREFLNTDIHLNIITETNEDCIVEYIINKNMINKLYSSETLRNKIDFKLLPYKD